MEKVKSRSFSRICCWTTTFQYIYLNYLFVLSEFTVCNFADTPFYVCDIDLNSLLEHDSFLATESCDNNI